MGKTETIQQVFDILSKRAPRPDAVQMITPGYGSMFYGTELHRVVSQKAAAASAFPLVLLIDDAHLFHRWWEPVPIPVRQGRVKLVCATGLRLRPSPPAGDIHLLWHPPAGTPPVELPAGFNDILEEGLTASEGWWEHYRRWGGHPTGSVWSWRKLTETLTMGAPRRMLNGAQPRPGQKIPSHAVNRIPAWLNPEVLRGLAAIGVASVDEWNRQAGKTQWRWAEAAGMVHQVLGCRSSNLICFRSPVALADVSAGSVASDWMVVASVLGLLAEVERNGQVSYYPNRSSSSSAPGLFVYKSGQTGKEAWEGKPATVTLVAFPDEPAETVAAAEEWYGQECLVRTPGQVAYAAARLLVAYRECGRW